MALELDKFKRRLIRSVARKFQQKDKPEEELWEELDKETKSNCKVLWDRMRALAIKKLKRLLAVADRLDSMIAAAQMTLSDWLLFDLMLVHEDIDVIGQDLLQVKDPCHLHELFELIVEFGVEMKEGEDLVSAWTQVTYNYNNRGRQCSPMLLQKRWYQMKKKVRLDFYNFWYSYRGNARLLEKIQHLKPSNFEVSIARRYPYIVIKQFTEWSKLVEEKRVVLPEEFENKLKAQNLPKTVPKKVSDTEHEPDLVLVEQNIEVIEVPDGDSDKEKNTEELTEPKPTQNVVVKSEPVDEIELDTRNKSERLMEELSKGDANLLSSIPDIDDEVGLEDANVGTADESGGYDHSNIPGPSDSTIDTIPEPEPIMPQITNVFGNVASEAAMALINDVTSMVDSRTVETSVMEEHNIEESTMEENNMDKSITIEENEVLGKENPETEINTADSEVDEKLKSFLETQKNESEKPNVGDINQTEAKKSTHSSSSVENSLVSNPFLGVPTDLTFAEDGIELVDDGIEFEDEEDIIKPYGSTSKQSDVIEPKEERVETREDTKFDLKLLMVPTVLITKLDYVLSLKNKNIHEVKGEQLINSIILETNPKPIKDETSKLKQMLQDRENSNSSIEINDDLSDDISMKTDIIPDEVRVKPTSYLLQKPRSRTYNPIQLCKNPDFNTRLKRLTVGFLSSTRNRAMLKTLKPMTIDVSKAFENKLVDGQTLYLKSHDTTAPTEKVIEAKEQVAVVLPSAMPVQSLIDQVNARVISPSKTSDITLHEENGLPKRNKTITLPDIEVVRKMNQRLYTAEVTPMRAPVLNEKVMPPVQLINTSNTIETNTITKPPDKNQVEIDQSNNQKSDTKATKTGPKVGSAKRIWPTISWSSRVPNHHQNDVLDTNGSLLTFDTLNKIILVITDNPSLSAETLKTLPKKKKYVKRLKEFKNNENKILPTGIGNNATEIQNAVDSIAQSKTDEHIEPKKKINYVSKENTKKPSYNIKMSSKYCCWARSKLEEPLNVSLKHKCPRICKCCCRFALVESTWRKKKAKKASIVISDDEESPQKETKVPNIKIRHFASTQTPTLNKPTEKSLSIQDEISILCDESEKNVMNQNVSAACDCTSDSINNESSSELPLSSQVEKVENPRKMPRISVVPSSALVAHSSNLIAPSNALVAPTIKPIGHGNQYINLVPMFDKNKTVNNESVASCIETTTNTDDRKKGKKTVYINNRRNGVFGKGAPIFLGRNKILLTDGVFPDSLNLPQKKPEPSMPTIPNLLLPEGIQIVVLPDGQVSYVIDPAVQLDAEKMANLQQIILAVQQQLASAHPHAISQPVANIDLTSGDIGSDLNQPFENVVDNITQVQNTLITNSVDKVNVQTTDDTEAMINTRDAVVNICENLCETDNVTKENESFSNISGDNNELHQSKEDKNVNEVKEKNTPTKAIDHSHIFTGSPTSEKAVSDGLVNDIHSDNIYNNFSNNTNSKNVIAEPIPNKNTLLSDLMEMSGISMDDVTPIVTPVVTPIIAPIVTPALAPSETEDDIVIPPPLIHGPRYLQTDVNGEPFITTSPHKSITELSSVSSFAQLKHACENKNKFFTLDLETGTVSSINVCLKLAESKRKLKPGTISDTVIDLTEAEEDTEGVISDDLDSPSKRSTESPNIIRLTRKTAPDARSLLKSVLKSDNPNAKPLKLFKSVGILNRKQKSEENLNDNQTTGATGTGASLLKRYRKQQLKIVDSEVELGENSHMDSIEDNDSSDDEPLASVAKRMRHTEAESSPNLETVEPNERTIADPNNESEDTEMQTEPTDADFQDNVEEGDEDLEGEISFLCDGDDSDDNGDCILGV